VVCASLQLTGDSNQVVATGVADARQSIELAAEADAGDVALAHAGRRVHELGPEGCLEAMRVRRDLPALLAREVLDEQIVRLAAI
jgi:hypothetical protein